MYITLPEVSFALPRQNAKATSQNPPIINSIQFIRVGVVWCDINVA